MAWKPGDRFSYVKMCGDWGRGTVLEVNDDIITAHLDFQKQGETYRFRADDPSFFKGEIGRTDLKN